MKKKYAVYVCISCLLCAFAVIVAAKKGSELVTALSEANLESKLPCIVIDAGHGGEDGGAISCTGVFESTINLQISLRLDTLYHLLGYQTKLLRATDTALYTSGNTISAKKVSDLRQRVKMINETSNALFISIHQNQFIDPKYSCAQVFYRKESDVFALMMQNGIVENLNPGSNRKIKTSKGIYIMDHITCPGILIECGFLSNPTEEEKLRSPEYQKKLCSVIAAISTQYLKKSFLDQA